MVTYCEKTERGGNEQFTVTEKGGQKTNKKKPTG